MVATSVQQLSQRHPRRVSTPILLQMEAVECGAAALGIILGYYKRFVPLTELRQECGISRDGSKAPNILKAARHYGLNAKGFKAELAGLKELKPPYIIFWSFNHFLVVEGIEKNKVYLNDPGAGRRTISHEEFDRAFTGVVLTFEPGPDFRKGGKPRAILPALLARLKSSKQAIAFCLIVGLLLTLTRLGAAGFSQIFVDEILLKNQEKWLRPLLLGMGLTVLLQGLLTWLQSYYLTRLSTKLSITTSSQFLWHILRLPATFYAQRYAGEIGSRMQLNDNVASQLSGPMATTFIDITMIALYVGLMLTYDRPLTGLVIFFAFINFIALYWISRQQENANISMSLEFGKVSGVAVSSIQAIETIKASGLEGNTFTKFAGNYAKANNAMQMVNTQNQFVTGLPILLTALANAAILIAGGWRVMDGDLTIGMLVGYQALAGSFLSPINRLVNFGNNLQSVGADLNRLEDVLQNAVDPEVARETTLEKAKQFPLLTTSVHQLQGYLELHDVTFGYNHLEAPLIDHFSLSLKPGQRVAFVGGSGSGKSTLAKLICGLYLPLSGEILLDNVPREQIPRELLANSLAMVEQDIFLFGGTVRENLTLWDATISENDLITACKDADIHEAIVALPNGYDTKLSEGGMNLSGGQRQRLEIARALVRNPSYLVLDEATSALDSESEQIIEQNLRRRGCTCIVVAHRLSTIRDCDEIIVLQQGKVLQRGAYDELRQQEGLFLQLIRSEASA